jgi:hypothetical protein
VIPVPTVPAAVATTIVTCVVPVAGLRAVAGVGVVLGGRLGGVVAVAGVSPVAVAALPVGWSVWCACGSVIGSLPCA